MANIVMTFMARQFFLTQTSEMEEAARMDGYSTIVGDPNKMTLNSGAYTLAQSAIDKAVYDNGIKAIDRLNLNINPGEFCVLLGPSGCGKTTALRMIAGLESISDGYLKFNDVVVNSVAPKDRNISMVFQNYALYPFMSVYNNIAFGIKNKARNNPEYNDLKVQMKHAKNSNFDEIEEIKSELSIFKKGTATDRDKLLVLKRELKAAKIIKDIDEQKRIGIELEKLSNSLNG
uniref:ABC transporter domain-containing protein n=1 Tax=Biomphalaria glabrata TaxID=6526 RepID=A0A2C9KMD5_BIOGL